MYSGKRVLMLGLGRQGVALARYLAQAGARVTVSDSLPADSPRLAANMAALQGLAIEYVLGGHPLSLLDGADLLCLSGGVSPSLPVVEAACRRGIPLSNDAQIFLELCPAWTVGITGSAGKTTTTTLVGRMLAAAGWQAAGDGRVLVGGGGRVWVGGNIGNPLIADVEQMRAGDFAVLELSSFQLEIMTRSPQAAAVLNITPNHLDRHASLEAYTAAKSNILRYQSTADMAVLGLDDAGARGLASLARGRRLYFSYRVQVHEGVYVNGEDLIFRWHGEEYPLCRRADIHLRGRHNVLNVLAAGAITAAALTLSGRLEKIPDAVRGGLAGFTGVEHRLEFVRVRGGVQWYNDSIATTPERVIAALNAFEEPIILLAGGRDKKLPWEEFARLAARRVKHLVLFGEAGPLILRAVAAAQMEAECCTLCATLNEAVAVAASKVRSGDVVLLSPGGTSFDEFADFAERGAKFKELVNAL